MSPGRLGHQCRRALGRRGPVKALLSRRGVSISARRDKWRGLRPRRSLIRTGKQTRAVTRRGDRQGCREMARLPKGRAATVCLACRRSPSDGALPPSRQTFEPAPTTTLPRAHASLSSVFFELGRCFFVLFRKKKVRGSILKGQAWNFVAS